LEPTRVPRHGGVPGDRPGRRVPPRHQVGGADLRCQAHPRHGPDGAAPGHDRPPRSRVSRSPRRRARREGRRGGHHLPGSAATGRGGDPGAIREAIALLGKAERPIILAGSGVWWSDGAAAFQTFVEATGIPFYTTPISRGLIPEDHELAFLNARSKAFTEAD